MHNIHILTHKFCDYSLHIRGRCKSTISNYRSVIKVFATHARIQNIEEVTDHNVRDFFIHGRTHRNWKATSFIFYHKNLIVFFRWCVKNGYMTHNPTEDIETPKKEKNLPKKLTKQEALRLLEVVYNFPYDHKFLRYRNHAIFATFIFGGLRKGELLNLKLADVDIENLTIFIRQGKGSKDRIIPMSYTLAQSLTNYMQERKRIKRTCPEFFTSFNRNMGFTIHGMKWLVIRVREASGIRFTIHQLRHTFATLMLEGGCDIYSLSRMMGHADIKTTTIYLAASAEHLRGQIGKHPLNDSF